MKQTLRLFQIGMKQIVKDGMLLVLLPAPVLAGVLFKFGIPVLNSTLEEKLSFSLLPWYDLIDGLLICLTPMLVAMVSAFLLLDERSDGISSFYQITPAGDSRYLVARIGLPMLGSFCITILIGAAFSISSPSLDVITASAFLSTLSGLVQAMAVVSLAENRVEGLAFSKLLGITLLGLFFIWFVPPPYTYLCAVLPPFWVGMLVREGFAFGTFSLGVLICSAWIFLFSK